MAVHRRGYSQYDGPRTPERWRFWILSRYAFNKVFQSKFLVVFYVLCFVPMLVAMAAVYLSHRVDILLSLFPRAQAPQTELVTVNADFFLTLMNIQATLSVFVTALIGPGLVSPDLTNNALPLFFSRPFSRFEYVLAKFSVLFIVLSLVTNVPMLLIYLLKSGLAGSTWFIENIHLAFAIFIGSLVWVSALSLISLATSACLRWRPAAAGMMFALFFVPTGFGQAANQIMRTGWGTLLNATVVIVTVWNSLFFINDAEGYARMAQVWNPMGYAADPIPAWSAWLMVASVCAVSLLLLNRKIRAHEVVR
jgi:ABC-type transport system involved in multi-copper enzyme maturation permease subunit